MKPSLWLFAVPVANAFLLFKEVLAGQYDWSHILLTAVSLIVFSLVALYVASKVYSKESALFKD